MDWYCYAPDLPEWPVEYVVRDVWGAEPPKKVRPLAFPIEDIFITFNTGTDPCNHPEECMSQVRRLQRRAMDENGLSDIKYNFLIGGDGYVYEGRGWVAAPPKSKKFPKLMNRINIGYIGSNKSHQFPYHIMRIGMDIIHYGVENRLLAFLYKVVEWKRDGVSLPPFEYNKDKITRIYRIFPPEAYKWYKENNVKFTETQMKLPIIAF